MSPSRRPDVVARRPAATIVVAVCAGVACAVVVLASIGVADASTPLNTKPATRLTTTTSTTVPPADAALAQMMLRTTLPHFSLASPGARNGPLNALALTTFLGAPATTTRLYKSDAAESGFAAWIKTWQDPLGVYFVRELAFHFHRSAEATQLAARFVDVFRAGAGDAGAFPAPGISGGLAFAIAEPGREVGGVDIPAQEVRDVVLTSGAYLAVIETDAQVLPGGGVVPAGAAIRLAQQQYSAFGQVGTGASAPAAAGRGTGDSWIATTLEAIGATLVVVLAAGGVQRRRLIVRRRRRRTEARRDAMERHATAMRPAPASSHRAPAEAEVKATVGVGTASNAPAGRSAHPSSRTATVAAARVRTETRSSIHPRAGWYTDPTDHDKRRIRYWNGSAWTTHVAEPAG